MILSRVIDHVRTQNWMAIAIDFVIVVMGVFIGIQVSNWNDARVQAARQQVYVERLREDFIGIRERIEEHLKVYGEGIEGGDYLLAIVRAGANDPAAVTVDDDRVGRAFNSLAAQRIPPPLPATYVEMVSEGQLSSLGNYALRDKLAEYDRLASIVQEVSRAVIDLAMAQTPILYRHFATRSVVDDRVLSGIEEQVLSYDVPAMRGDPEFAVAVTLLRRNALNSLEQRKIQLRLIGEIVSLIDAEQD